MERLITIDQAISNQAISDFLPIEEEVIFH